MDVPILGMTGVAAVTTICYLIGQMVKVTALDNRLIPVIVGIAGGILGIVGMHLMPDFPASDYLTAIAVGIASGLSSTGADQLLKQLGGIRDDGQ